MAEHDGHGIYRNSPVVPGRIFEMPGRSASTRRSGPPGDDVTMPQPSPMMTPLREPNNNFACGRA